MRTIQRCLESECWQRQLRRSIPQRLRRVCHFSSRPVATHRLTRQWPTGWRTLALIAAPLPGTGQTFSQTLSPTFLAVVRHDGLLVPIAVFDGAEWWNRWPWGAESDEEIKTLPVPPNLRAIPKDWLPPSTRLPAEWRLLIGSGGRTRIRATEPVRPSEWDLMTTTR